MTNIEPPRKAADDQDRYLLQIGWKPAGLALFIYPHDDLRRAYTKDQALALTEELGLGLYCSLCGACGEEGCCSPDKCGCMYKEHYDTSHKTLLEENELMYKFVEQVYTFESSRSDELSVMAKQLMNKLKE